MGPLTVASLLRERGAFPPARDERGRTVDPSPLAGLSPLQRRKRLVGILELLACHGDGPAAAEALRHARWEEEMKKGKAPQRVDLNAVGEIRVIDDLRSPGDTPVSFRPRPPRATA
jgi:hypothetical protein